VFPLSILPGWSASVGLPYLSGRSTELTPQDLCTYTMATMRTLLLLAVGVMQTAAMYTARSPVVTLDPSNFQEKVKSSEGVFLVEFYAPWWVPSIRTLPDSPLTNPHRRCPPPGGGCLTDPRSPTAVSCHRAYMATHAERSVIPPHSTQPAGQRADYMRRRRGWAGAGTASS
jgi:hypothetical protein